MVLDLDDLKAYMRITGSSTDALLTTYLTAVEAWAEQQYGFKLASDDAIEYVDGGSRVLYVDRRPVTEVTKITDTRTGSIEEAADYSLMERGILRVADGDPFWAPGVARFKVEYEGGYATVPGNIQIALFGIVARLFQNRQGAASIQSKGGTSLSFDAIRASDLGVILETCNLRRFC